MNKKVIGGSEHRPCDSRSLGVLQEVLRQMSAGNGASEFSVALPPPKVRQKAHRYMLDRGFGIEADLAGDVVEYTAVRPRNLLLRLVGIPPDFYRARLSIRRQGKGRTHLMVKASKRGRWPNIQGEMERWIIEELGGEPSP